MTERDGNGKHVIRLSASIVLTVLGIVGSAGVTWGLMQGRVNAAESKQVDMAERLRTQETRIDNAEQRNAGQDTILQVNVSQLADIRERLLRIEAKLDRR